jgi:VWFA-related protein
MRRAAVVGLAGVALFVFSVPASARQVEPPLDKPTFGARVELVEVDAVVTDGKGRHVTDLTAADFEIREHGRPQAIANFQYVVLDPAAFPPAAPAAATPAPAPPVVRALGPEDMRRSLLIVVDDLSLAAESTIRARRMLARVVEEQMRPGDVAAIYQLGSAAKKLDFSNEKPALLKTIEKLRFNLRGRGGEAPKLPPLTQEQVEGARNFAGFLDRMDRTQQLYLALHTLDGLEAAVKALSGLPGRRALVLLSEGFVRYDSGRGEGGGRDPFRVDARLQDVVDEANRSSVVVYSLDPSGLRTLGPTAADPQGAVFRGEDLARRMELQLEVRSGLATLADGTGGLLVADTNDLVGAAKTIFADLRGYYLIGYTPDEATPESADGRPVFHKLEVKVKRPGLTVRSRRSFVSTE